MPIRTIVKLVEVEPNVKGLLFFLGEFVELVDSNLSFYNFSLNFLTIWTVAEIFDIRRFQRTPRVLNKLSFNHVNTFQGRFVVLSLDDGALILFVHAFDGLSSIALKILIAGFNREFDIYNLLLPKIFEIHVFCSIYFLLILLNFDFHFVYERNSDRVQKFGTKPEFHVRQDDEKECTARPELAVLSLKLFLFFKTDNCIK